MKVSNSYNPYSVGDMGTTKMTNSVKEYSEYLMGKYGCLTPGKNSAVSITNGLLKKAMSDEKTGAWLERELSNAPDYIAAAQKSASARGATLRFVSIEFGEEYSTMTTMTVTDGGGTDSEIDKWLEKLKEKKEEKKIADKKLEKKKAEEKRLEKAASKMELKGKDLEDLTNQFVANLSGSLTMLSTTGFDVKA